MRLQELDFIDCTYRSARVWADGRYCTLYACNAKHFVWIIAPPPTPKYFHPPIKDVLHMGVNK